jgi:hypothetical protein
MSSVSSLPSSAAAGESSEDATAPPLSSSTRSSLERIPLLTARGGPRDGELWIARLKQELTALIAYQKHNKQADQDWFVIQPDDQLGTR